MSYITIYRTVRHNRIIMIKGIFEQNNLNYRLLKENNPADFPKEVKVQVKETDRQRAMALLKEYGFLSRPSDPQSNVSMFRFWLWLVIALLALITASLLINSFLKA